MSVQVTSVLLQLNDCLVRICKAVEQTTSLYSSAHLHPAQSPHTVPVFLSQCHLDCYHKVEENYTQQLTAYTKRLFFEVQ